MHHLALYAYGFFTHKHMADVILPERGLGCDKFPRPPCRRWIRQSAVRENKNNTRKRDIKEATTHSWPRRVTA